MSTGKAMDLEEGIYRAPAGEGVTGRYMSDQPIAHPGDQADEERDWVDVEKAARDFLEKCSMEPTQDAVNQLLNVFLPCLEIMCDPAHPWDPNGATWRKSGILGAMTDAKKKWERFWERTWSRGKRHDDSGFDLINFIGFVMRSDPDSRWGEWGEPAHKTDD